MIKDEYFDSQGRKFVPKLYTESHCFLRCDHHGSIHLRMCRIDQETGEVRFNRAAQGFRSGIDDPCIWMRENSISLPRQYYGQAVQEALDKAGICEDCERNEQIVINEARLIESKRPKEDGNE